jgi:hypothetical protein
MKRASGLSWLLSRDLPWLAWWQELILNWVASWASLSTILVVSADGEERCEWDLPTDVELARAELEEQFR